MGLNKPIVIVLDNARYQKCKLVQNDATSVSIQLCYLPFYSPQLNWVRIF
ncbi:Mobile element protein [Richelia intracellularis]|nr:Mobile element protein [Richelia intracellularis]